MCANGWKGGEILPKKEIGCEYLLYYEIGCNW